MRRVLLALLLCVAGLACGKGGSGDDQSFLELRPVLTSTAPPCPAAKKAPKKDEVVVLPVTSSDGNVAECLELGRAIADADDVRSATVGDTQAGEPALLVVFGAAGSSSLDNFAQHHQGERLAILADGSVVNAPAVRFPSFAGRVQVTGLSKERTDDLFRRLNDLIKS
jgi:preprotein translocase subunit SecD